MVEAFDKRSSSKYADVVVRPGDRLQLVTAGGGYGEPAKRDPALVREDLAEGYISRANAATAYGYSDRGDD